MKVVVGCDGGGTKTIVRVQAIDSNGSVLSEGRGQSGPSNVSLDRDAAVRNICSATEKAFEQAQLRSSQSIDVIVAALAGAGRREHRESARSMLLQAFNVIRVEVVPDAAVLFAAASVSGPVIALNVGTGSIAWARNDHGTIHRFGGWGPLLGDEGSGYWIGLEAIKRTVCRLNEHASSRPPAGSHPREMACQTEPLTRQVLDHFSSNSLDQLISAVYGQREQRAAIAELAPKVCAQFDNSEIAREIIQSASVHLANLVVSAAHAAFGKESTRNLSWICAGGVGVSQNLLRERVHQQCRGRGLLLMKPILVEHPVDGALTLARSPLPPTEIDEFR